MGAAIAQRLLDAGAKVVVTGRSRGEATRVGATFIAGDVSSVEGVKAIAAEAVGALGGLDILVNNAGGARSIAEGTASILEEEWQAAFGLNPVRRSPPDECGVAGAPGVEGRQDREHLVECGEDALRSVRALLRREGGARRGSACLGNSAPSETVARARVESRHP